MLQKEAGGLSISEYKNYISTYLDTTKLTTGQKYDIWNELFK